MDRSHNYPKMLGRTGSPIMTECTAAMVSCCHLIDHSQSLFYFVPQEYQSQAGSTTLTKSVSNTRPPVGGEKRGQHSVINWCS